MAKKNHNVVVILQLGFPCGSAGKESACNAGDLGWEDPLEKVKVTQSSILAWKIPRTLAKSCKGVAKSRTQMSDFHFTSFILQLK